MRYWVISLLLMMTFFIVGCGNKSKNMKENKKSDEKKTEMTEKGVSDTKASKTSAVHLGKSLYLILESGKLDESHLIELDTGEEVFSTGAVVTFDILDKTESVPAKVKAENIQLSDGETVKNLKITFESAYAIKNFLGEKAALIDVRTQEEYEAGHVPDAELIPFDEIGEKAKNRFKKDDVIIVYCRSGNRSSTAQAVLENDGYLVLDIGGIGDYKGELEK